MNKNVNEYIFVMSFILLMICNGCLWGNKKEHLPATLMQHEDSGKFELSDHDFNALMEQLETKKGPKLRAEEEMPVSNLPEASALTAKQAIVPSVSDVNEQLSLRFKIKHLEKGLNFERDRRVEIDKKFLKLQQTQREINNELHNFKIQLKDLKRANSARPTLRGTTSNNINQSNYDNDINDVKEQIAKINRALSNDFNVSDSDLNRASQEHFENELDNIKKDLAFKFKKLNDRLDDIEGRGINFEIQEYFENELEETKKKLALIDENLSGEIKVLKSRVNKVGVSGLNTNEQKNYDSEIRDVKEQIENVKTSLSVKIKVLETGISKNASMADTVTNQVKLFKKDLLKSQLSETKTQQELYNLKIKLLDKNR